LKRSPLYRIALPALLLAFVGVGIAAGARDRGPVESDSTARVVASVHGIAINVEHVRHLTFKHIPQPVGVTPDETRRSTVAQLNKDYPASKRRDDAELLELLGLVPPGTDLGAVAGDISGGEVVGYYDPKTGRLAVVKGPSAGLGATGEITLAHELTHALEDQRFGIHDESGKGADDRSTAYTALVEGSATSVMNQYARLYIPPSAALVSAFAELGPSQQASSKVPAYLQRSLEFSYLAGSRFVDALRRRAHGWSLVNAALRHQPPVSSEQIIHPGKYLLFEPPKHVTIGDPGLGSGWRRAATGTLGEFDTGETVQLGNDADTARRAAAGWGGGRYAMWRNDAASAGCKTPCRRGGVVVLRWVWDTPRDAREFDAALPAYVTRGLHGVAAGPARWRIGSDGGAAITASAVTTTLALAPSPDEAARVAGAASR
jgi:hypothetical protein